MKRIFYLLSVFLALVIWPKVSFGNAYFCSEPHCALNSAPVFKRTYLFKNSLTPSVQVKITRKPRLRSAQDITVGYEDFVAHLGLGVSRTSKIIPVGNNISMDVKGIDETGDELQTWDMPDFSDFETLETNIEHVPLEASGFQDSFPDLTHAFYIEEVNAYELYGLSQDDLFLYGFGLFDENNQAYAEDYYSALAPLPMEWGLGYTGIITFILEDDIEYDSIVYTQYYDVVATGTLNTYDDGPVDALKLIFTEEGRAYKDGTVVEEGSFDEILWYSKKGHLLRAGFEAGSVLIGQTSPHYMEYQKITSTATATKNQHLQQLNYFPNPVAAGQTLTIELEESQRLGFADLIDAQGRVLKRLDLSNVAQQSTLQIDIPEQLPGGMYYYRLHNDQGALLGNGKLHVIK